MSKVTNNYDNFHDKTKSQHRVISRNNFTYRHTIYFIDKYLINKNKRVVDIGCGAGTLCFYIAKRVNFVLGLDISPKAIVACKESSRILGLSKIIRFKVTDFPNEPLNEKFDVVIFTEVIEHIKNDNIALKSIYNMLNKGGIVIISTPSLNAPLYKLGYAKGFDRKVGHFRRYTLEGLSNQCRENGFNILESKKVEGVLRNFLFINPVGGKLIRTIKFFLSDVVTYLDNLLIPIFGESNIVIVAQKPL